MLVNHFAVHAEGMAYNRASPSWLLTVPESRRYLVTSQKNSFAFLNLTFTQADYDNGIHISCHKPENLLTHKTLATRYLQLEFQRLFFESH